ncbi:MAG: PQQ-binding-like beta-propeller repeat protein [Planctomycetota bacterium]
MLAKELIDRLERMGWLDQEIIEALREQLQQSGNRITPEAVAKLLVDNGQLTRFQATKLIGELRSDQYDDDGPSESEEDAGDDLTFLDSDANADEVEAIAEAVPVAVAEPVMTGAPLAEPVEEDLAASIPEAASPRQRRTMDSGNTIWDSFKVYGRAGIIVLLLLAGGALFFVLRKGDADTAIKRANKLYDQDAYQPAQEQYLRFLEDYGEDNQHSSVAKTRAGLTELYRAEGVPDPTVGLKVAREVLPGIAEEPALNDDRDDLAALLVDIAENIAGAADKAKETAEKQDLLGKLDEQIEFMSDPLYISSKMRLTLATRLAGVNEDRARVQREIDRNLQLDQAVVSMKSSLESQETKAAYDTREALLRDFPELLANDRIDELIREASGIQKELVKPSSQIPKTLRTAVKTDELRAIALTTLVGDAVPSLRGEKVYVRASGSVLAFSAENGRLLWRKYVGLAQDHSPVRTDGGESVLLTNGDRNEVARCDGETGKVVWRSVVDEPFSSPVVTRKEAFVAGESGRLISMDLESGDARWVTQIPQELEVGPGVDSRSGKAYQTGGHSNLYVLNTRDGACTESFYIGHRSGTVAVAPVPLLEHLFVFENTDTTTTTVHVLRTDSEGGNLEVAQPPFQMRGNVKVQPIVQKRRLIVLTDRGQVNVFDVEPSAESKEKVSTIAKCSPSYKRPTPTQMTAAGSQMWITGTRLARFELQINTGQVVRDWVKHEGDSFVGQPVAIDDTLIHARVMRDTSGIRVTALSPKSGDVQWRTDVGVPVAMLRPVPDEEAFHATSSQGALFKIDRDTIASGSTKGPIENPGGKGVAMRFLDPIDVRKGDQPTSDRIIVNQEEPSEILLYEPNRNRDKLRKVTIQLPGNALPSGRPVVSGGGLLVPLDTGRIILIRPQTGVVMGSPFQPASDPTGKVIWSDPLALADDPDQVVIADSRRQLYRLRVGEQIRELSSVELSAPLLGPTARVGQRMIATKAGPAADFVVGFDMTTLETSFEKLLDGRVQWGPMAIEGDDQITLIQTDDGVLRALDEQGDQSFEIELPKGPIAGKPFLRDGKILIAGIKGWIRALDAKTGQVVGQADLGQPISATPLMVGGGQLLVPGGEGVIYIVSL